MVHDVFISHSTKDAKVAGSICQHLEQNGIHCWIAPRDIPPSADWPASIAEAIPNCRVVVLILSSNSNKSKQVEREIGIAADRELPVIPFRIEEVNPEGSLGFFLGSTQRIDAVKPPLEDHLQKLNKMSQG